MAGRQDELLILMIRHFIPIDRKRIQVDGSWWLLIEPSALCSTNERPLRNRHHFLLNRCFFCRAVLLRLGHIGRTNRLFEWREGGASQDSNDGHGGTGQYDE